MRGRIGRHILSVDVRKWVSQQEFCSLSLFAAVQLTHSLRARTALALDLFNYSVLQLELINRLLARLHNRVGVTLCLIDDFIHFFVMTGDGWMVPATLVFLCAAHQRVLILVILLSDISGCLLRLFCLIRFLVHALIEPTVFRIL